MRPVRLLLLMSVGLALAVPQRADALWPIDPQVNLPVCVAPGDQGPPHAVTNGLDGVILAWKDGRAGGQIYAQHVSGLGVPQWAPNGIALGAAGATSEPLIVPDLAYGAVIAWIEDTGTSRVFKAQRLNAAGIEQWTPGGLTLRSRVDQPVDPGYSRWYWDKETAVSDGAGGLFLLFQERHEENNAVDPSRYTSTVLVVHCDGAGVVEADRIIASDQYICAYCGDGFFHMDDFDQLAAAPRIGQGLMLAYRARPIINHGTRSLAPEIRVAEPIEGWSTVVVTGSADVRRPRVATDNSGAGYVTWEDTRGGGIKIYASRVTPTGALPWGADGLPVCGAAGDQSGQEMFADYPDLTVAWLDHRSGAAADVFIQKIDEAGARLWGSDGLELCVEPTAETDLAIVRTTGGNAAVAWRDTRSGTGDIYARLVSPFGVVYGPVDGYAVTNASLEQSQPTIVDSWTDAIVAWRDRRGAADDDVYAQRVGQDGPVNGLGYVLPAVAVLAPAVPTPSRGITRLHFSLPSEGSATMWIADIRGRLVTVIGSGPLPAGEHAVTWDGRDDAGREVGSGIYFVVLDADGRRRSQRIVRVR